MTEHRISNDLVAVLRNVGAIKPSLKDEHFGLVQVCANAADEIEHLREALRRAHDYLSRPHG